MQKILKLHKKLLLLLLLAFFQIIVWVINPPIYKIQRVEVTKIETTERKSGFNVEKYKTIFYSYKNKDAETIEGQEFQFAEKFTSMKVGEKIELSVPSSFSEGGEFRFFAPTVFIMLLFSVYFLLVVIFRKMMLLVFQKEIKESSADAIVFVMLIVFLIVYLFV